MRRFLLSCVCVSSLVGFVLLVGCSSDDAPGGGNDAGTGASGGSGGSSAGMSAGGKTGSGGGAGTGAVAGTASPGGGAGAGGSAGSAAGAGTAGSASGNGGNLNGGAGNTTGGAGSGGMAAGAGMAGGGMATGGAGGDATGGMAGMGGAAAGAAGAAGAGGPPACPSGALFCSGFEDAMLPTGATYLSSNDNNDWTKGTALDMAVFHAGAQSIQILKISSYAQREIVVPAAQNFWFRAYFRTDVAVGGAMGKDHNLFFEAAYPGGDKGVEIVEEDCMLGMNIDDTRFGSNGTKNQPGCPSGGGGTQLEANAWHCIEGHFDGAAGNVELFVAGTQVMALMGENGAKRAYNALRFGYRHYHERQRLVWYDDVATAAARVGCQ